MGRPGTGGGSPPRRQAAPSEVPRGHPGVPKGPPRRPETPTQHPQGPPRRPEGPTPASGEVRLRAESALPRVRGAAPSEERAAAPVREKRRREEGGLEVSGGGRYSPTGRRPSAEPLLRGAAGRERPQHNRSGGRGVGHAREVRHRGEESRSPDGCGRVRRRPGTLPTRTAGGSRGQVVPLP